MGSNLPTNRQELTTIRGNTQELVLAPLEESACTNTSNHCFDTGQPATTKDVCSNGIATTSSVIHRRESLPGLDALRGLAALGVVLLHACVPYMDPKVPGLAWSVMDDPQWIVAQCFWFIEIFIMPVFLMLAGYFALCTLQRSGPLRLIRSRARRLLIPLGFGALFVLPADLYVWLTGWVADGKIPLRKMKSLKFAGDVDQDLWGLSHLWFLEYLFLYILLLGLAYAAYQRFPFLRRVVRRPKVCVAALLAVASITLVFHPEVVWGFQHRFYPVPSKWIYSGAFFAVGVCLALADDAMNWLSRSAVRHAGYAIAFMLPAMALGQWHLRGGDQVFANVMLAVTTTASASLTTIGLLGFAARVKQPIAMPWRYLAAASFWIYLVHHPVLGLLQIDMKWLLPETTPLLKVSIGWVSSVLISLVTYEVWVRKTALGALLGFGYSLPSERQSRVPVGARVPQREGFVRLSDRTDKDRFIPQDSVGEESQESHSVRRAA